MASSASVAGGDHPPIHILTDEEKAVVGGIGKIYRENRFGRRAR
jgi:hypothetical protein